MSERAGQNLEEEIVMLGAVRMTAVEEAQGSIVRVIRALEESSQIVVSRGNDEFADLAHLAGGKHRLLGDLESRQP